jgi:hypothetical protein
MAEVLYWRTMGLREVRRTERRQRGLKDPTAVEVVRRVTADELGWEGVGQALATYGERRVKKIKAWCRRRARRRRQRAGVWRATAGLEAW